MSGMSPDAQPTDLDPFKGGWAHLCFIGKPGSRIAHHWKAVKLHGEWSRNPQGYENSIWTAACGVLGASNWQAPAWGEHNTRDFERTFRKCANCMKGEKP